MPVRVGDCNSQLPAAVDTAPAARRGIGSTLAVSGGVTTVLELDTSHGPARARLQPAEEPRAALLLGHGAAAGVETPDLVAATEAARSEGITVALVEQPYRVAGRRSPPRAPQLDAAWISVVERLRAGDLAGLPLVVGGRSMGARVACRTADATGAVAVLCLAFPLEPPRRAGKPPQSRLPELDAVTVPALVVQGERDRFGIPPPGPSREVVTVPGDHGLKADPEAVAAAVRAWLPGVVAETASAR
jgi:predicted alpha/beta-hydrolase family hydrolase